MLASGIGQTPRPTVILASPFFMGQNISGLRACLTEQANDKRRRKRVTGSDSEKSADSCVARRVVTIGPDGPIGKEAAS